MSYYTRTGGVLLCGLGLGRKGGVCDELGILGRRLDYVVNELKMFHEFLPIGCIVHMHIRNGASFLTVETKAHLFRLSCFLPWLCDPFLDV